MAVQIDAEIKNIQEVMDWISKKNDDGKKAMEWTIKDLKRGAKALTKKEVQKQYNASAKIFSEAKITTQGQSLYEFQINYSSRNNTLVNFGLQPTKNPDRKMSKGHWKYYKKQPREYIASSVPYEVTAEIIKGKRASFGITPGDRKKGGANAFRLNRKKPAFKRKGDGIMAIHTLSLSAMVTSPRVEPNLINALNIKAAETLEKKLAQAIADM